MNDFPRKITKTLLQIIETMESERSNHVKNPGIDFSRKRKMDFKSLILFMLVMEGNTIGKELYDYFSFSIDTITKSGFIQQREKLLPTTMEYIFNEFNAKTKGDFLYHGYRLLACDGTRIPICRNEKDSESFYKPNRVSRGFNQLHLNALYDLCSRKYIDAVVRPRHTAGEHNTMEMMMDRLDHSTKTIIVADRGYESYNTIAHAMENGLKFVIRVKDTASRSGILTGQGLSRTDAFDTMLHLHLTHTRSIWDLDRNYFKLLYSSTNLDYLSKEKPVYDMDLRIVRFPVSENEYECVVTNLSYDEFTDKEIKKIYKLRWGIESSFRELKYTIGILNFHTKKTEQIIQEIFARLVVYNFCETIIRNHLVKHLCNKHTYQLNYTMAIHICRQYLRCDFLGCKPPNVGLLLRHNILPVREGRKYPRNIQNRGDVSFVYRVP